MGKTRSLLKEDITYSDARYREVNVLHQLGYFKQRNDFFNRLDKSRDWIKAIVAHHLNLKSGQYCLVSELEDWIHGSFNLCIPVTITHWNTKQQPGDRVILRLPLPYRVGDIFNPGNGNEKLRCEAGTYAWIQEYCSDIPIPRLYGFALSTGEGFTRLRYLLFWTRYFQYIRRQLFQWLGWDVSSDYNRHDFRPNLLKEAGKIMDSGYMLIEYIENGEMLSNTWPQNKSNKDLRTNLFRGLSRIMLSLFRIPLPQIGSFIIDNNGYLILKNRPLSLEIQDLENQEIPTDIPRDCTYNTVDSYYLDILGCHDSRFRHQPNAMNDSSDGALQLAVLTAMRAIMPAFIQKESRRGPFVMSFTDLHASNIFVDKDWNITSLIDLEWAFSQPVDMVQFPHWFANHSVDQFTEEEYDEIRKEFIDILTFEETKGADIYLPKSTTTGKPRPRLSSVMEEGWELGTFWYTLALSSPTGIFHLFYQHIQHRLCKKHSSDSPFVTTMPWYWTQRLSLTIKQKLKDKEEYDTRLAKEFGEDMPVPQ